jgi:tripartite-type tricarboxylate transporter receptor subunit TctC
MLRLLFLVLAGVIIASPAAAQGAPQAFPERPITLVLPFGPGSATDVFARIIAKNLQEVIGQSVVIENKPGGNATIAAEQVARAQPDGHTLMVSTATAHAANLYLLKDIRYDPIKDFEPISRLGTVGFFVAVNGPAPYRTLDDLLQDARKNPGKLTFANSSASAIVSSQAIMKWAGVDMIAVPYRSSPPAMTDLLGGRITTMIGDFAAAASFLEAKSMRPLAVTGIQRSKLHPDVPTLDELGLKGFDLIGWFGLYAPAKTPKRIIDILNAKVVEVIARPQLKPQFDALGYEAFSTTPEQLLAHTKAEIAAWARYTREFDLKLTP